MRIDFVSDLSCPWCAIGLRVLEQAIERIADQVPVTLHLQPFELNPDLPPEGEAITDYAARKHGVGAVKGKLREQRFLRRLVRRKQAARLPGKLAQEIAQRLAQFLAVSVAYRDIVMHQAAQLRQGTGIGLRDGLWLDHSKFHRLDPAIAE